MCDIINSQTTTYTIYQNFFFVSITNYKGFSADKNNGGRRLFFCSVFRNLSQNIHVKRQKNEVIKCRKTKKTLKKIVLNEVKVHEDLYLSYRKEFGDESCFAYYEFLKFIVLKTILEESGDSNGQPEYWIKLADVFGVTPEELAELKEVKKYAAKEENKKRNGKRQIFRYR